MALKFAEKFINMMTLNDSDDDYNDYEDDYEEVDNDFDDFDDYDEDDDEDEEDDEDSPSPRSFFSFNKGKSREPDGRKDKDRSRDRSYGSYSTDYSRKVVPFQVKRGEGDIVKVIKPTEFNNVQAITDHLREGKTIVINLEGLEINLAQRIMDFVSGASAIIDGSVKAISNNIFIVAPGNIEVSGDLREQYSNETVFSPDLGNM